jgi:hypothetical protein
MLDMVMAADIPAVSLSAEDALKVETLLLRTGMSAIGARQVTLGQPMTSPADRQRVAGLLARIIL